MLDKCGINFPNLAYRELTGGNIGSKDINYDIRIAWRYMFEDLLAIRDYIRTKQLSRMKVFKSMLIKKVPAIWSPDDPAPTFNFMYILLRKAIKRVFK